MATAFHNAGVHVSTHAIGDRAIDWVVDTYAQALAAKPTRGLRHGIIHANTPTDHAIDEMARLQRDFDAGVPRGLGRRSCGGLATTTPATSAGAQPADEAAPDLAEEGHALGRRLRLLGDAVRGALRPVGVGGARDAERHLRQDAVRHGTRRSTCARRCKLVHDLGGAHDVPRRPRRLDRSRQGRRPGGVGSRSCTPCRRRR